MYVNNHKNVHYQPFIEFENISEMLSLSMGSKRKSKPDQLINELIGLRSKAFILSLCIDILNVERNKEVIDIISGYGIVINTENDEVFYKSLLNIERFIKGYNNKINAKNEELTAIIKDNQKETKNTNYLKQIVVFEEILKRQIDAYGISLAQFAAYSNQIKENNGRRDT